MDPTVCGHPAHPGRDLDHGTGRNGIADHGSHRIVHCRNAVVDPLLVERARFFIESGQSVADESGQPVERHGPHGVVDPAHADLDGGTGGRGAGHGHALTGSCAAYPPVQ